MTLRPLLRALPFAISLAWSLEGAAIAKPKAAAKTEKAEKAEGSEDEEKPAKKADKAEKADKKHAKKDAEDDGAKRVKSKYLIVRARELKLNESRTEALVHIAEAYQTATHQKLVATGGTRSPLRQAQLMYGKFNHKGDGGAVYENGAALTEIRKAYDEGREEKLSRAKIEKAMTAIIEAQVARGVFISRHLQRGAVDIRSRGMSSTQEAAFRAAVAAETGVGLIDERSGPEPHFHLNLEKL